MYTYLAALALLWAATQDWRSYTIPYGATITVAATALLQADTWPPHLIFALSTGAALLFISLIMSKLLNHPVLGYGDIQLFTACLLWLEMADLPLFLISAGLAGMLLATISRRNYFPFAPGIAGAWGVTMIS